MKKQQGSIRIVKSRREKEVKKKGKREEKK